MELLIILALILINGLFSMSEMAMVSARRFKLESAKRKGHKGAARALALSNNPGRFLSTVQIGITLIGILLGIYSGENITGDLMKIIERFPLLAPYAHTLAVFAIVVIVTYLSILFGELLPKRIGMAKPETIASALARPMQLLSVVTAPFVWLLTQSNEGLLKIFGIAQQNESKVTEEELRSLVKESAEGGEIQDIESNIVSRVFELGDRKVGSLLTHRSDLVFFDLHDSRAEVLQKISQEKHSAYPVMTGNNPDEVLGIVLLKDLFEPTHAEHFELSAYLREPVWVNESVYAYKLLELFKQKRMHYAIVVDEYGTTVGMITMDDVLDALVGDMTEAGQDEYEVVRRDENSWLIDGQYPVIEFRKQFDIPDDEDEADYHTLAGLLIHVSETLPQVGDRFVLGDYTFEVVDKDGQRIDKVMVTLKG